MKKVVLVLLVILAGAACSKKNELKNKNGFIVNVACSRGCSQFLIQVDDVMYYPVNLTKNFEQDKLAVTVSGTILKSTKEVLKPSAVDAPVHDFDAPEINLKTIVAR